MKQQMAAPMGITGQRTISASAALAQRGFSLVEVIITIAIIGILTAGLMTALSSGDNSKITALFSKTQDIVKAVSLYQAKTSCTPNNLEVLFDKALATAANNFCNQNTTALYGTEDYISAMPLAAAGGLDLTKIGFPGGYVTIVNTVGGNNVYALQVTGLTTTEQEQFMNQCIGQNGVDYTTGTAMPAAAQIVTNPCADDGTNVFMLINKY